jgi:transposase
MSAKVDSTDFAVAERRLKVSEMYRQGLSQSGIAIKLKVAQSTISADLAAIREHWKRNAELGFNDRVAEELAKLDHLEAVAWQQFLKSCEDGERVTKRTELGRLTRYNPAKARDKSASKNKGAGLFEESDKLVPLKVYEEVVKTGRTGDPRFLDHVARCIEMRCKILHVLEPEKGNEVNVNLVNWDELVQPRPRTDPVAERLKQAAAALPAHNGAGNGKPGG